MANMLRQNKLIVYKLKRQYGLSGHIVYLEQDSYNTMTGAVERVWLDYYVRRMIFLPDLNLLKTYYTGPFYQAGRPFTHGAFFDESTRPVIIDKVDLRNMPVPLTNRDMRVRATFSSVIKEYTIKNVTLVEEDSSYLLSVSCLESES